MLKKILGKKIKEDEEATAFAFQEFINEFQNTAVLPCKTFVRSSILNANKEQEIDFLKGTIYNPQPLSKIQSSQTVKNAIECARLVKETKIEKIKGQQKPKTNLELLKEELKMRHTERDEKHKLKEDTNITSGMDVCEGSDSLFTTNLFLSNLSQKYTEKDLIQLFGSYGPLASVKIMWPRSEEKFRTTNCGFVAFMSRKDSERALEKFRNRDDMRVHWGKPVEIPPNPIYIPFELLKLSCPPPYSGLPFNAQPLQKQFKVPESDDQIDECLYNSVVKVTFPLDKKLQTLVHRMVEFVVREGPFFEAIIMNREINNPNFQFLFDNKSPVHTYYRWKLYSVLHGEGQKNWSKKSFRMYKGGPIWIPPIIPDYTKGMPENLIETEQKDDKKQLSDTQALRFNSLVQNLNLSKIKIGEAMVFCMNHIEAADDIKDILVDSLKNAKTKANKKVARLYLLSDILCNSMSEKFKKIYPFKIESELISIFENFTKTFDDLQNAADKEALQARIIKVLRAWSLFRIYPNEFLNKLESVFLGTPPKNKTDDDSDIDTDEPEPLDGANLLKRSMKSYHENVITKNNTDRNDVHKKQNCANSVKFQDNSELPSGFIPSKWERVDPEQVEAQAMSTEKFYHMEMERKFAKEMEELSKKNREMLRKIELKVLEYQDDIESGKVKVKSKTRLEDEVENYRKKLLASYRRDEYTNDEVLKSHQKRKKEENNSEHKNSKSRHKKSRT